MSPLCPGGGATLAASAAVLGKGIYLAPFLLRGGLGLQI